MSFIGNTIERKIKTKGRTFKIFITEQEGETWISTILFSKDGEIDAHHEASTDKTESFFKASEWVLNNIDDHAEIQDL